MIDTKTRVAVGSELYNETIAWQNLEVELLDEYREREWLEGMVSRDVVYQVPLRQTVERARGLGFSGGAFHLDETWGSLQTRVARNETDYAWAEDPPSRIRHFVTNTRVDVDTDELLEVRSHLLIYRLRQEQTQPQLLSGERQDVLRREGGVLMLYRRQVLLDVTVFRTHNLSIFF